MTQETLRSSAHGRSARRGSWLWSRLHFLLRLLGLTGLLALCVGLVLAWQIAGFYSSWTNAHNIIRDTIHGHGVAGSEEKTAIYAIVGGTAAFLLLLITEMVLVPRFVAGRRSLMGFNALVQITLAAALLVGVNLFAFWQPLRFDCTSDKEFTLPDSVRADLQKLQGETLIVVHVRPNPGQRTTPDYEADQIENAADRQVVELVKDLVDQFRQARRDQRFRVVELDVRNQGYREKFAEVTKNAKPLQDAIEATPESSIFFYADGKVQQLNFKEFYKLDLAASKESHNLVLLPQGEGTSGRGVETFARKIFNVEERRPRIGLLVVHELLTTDGANDALAHKGLRKSLEAHGFEVRDIVLWKNVGRRDAEPVAYTLNENRLVVLENRVAFLNARLRFLDLQQQYIPQLVKELSAPPSADEVRRLLLLSRTYFPLLQGQVLTPEDKPDWIEYFERKLKNLPDQIAEKKQERDKAQKDIEDLQREGVDLGRRMTDLSGKMSRVLAECDLLYIPRLTRRDPGDPIPYRVHRLNEQHLAAIREFLKSGKPILACVGPLNEPPDADFPPDPGDKDDNLEKLLADLGIYLAPQTVLFNIDSKAIADFKSNGFLAPNSDDNVPRIDLNGAGAIVGYQPIFAAAAIDTPNPLRSSLQVTAHSAGPAFDLGIRFARPVYYDPTHSWLNPAAEAAGNFGLLLAPNSAGPLLAYSVPPRKVRRLADQHAPGAAASTATAQIIGTAAAGGLTPLGMLWNLPARRIEPAFLFTPTAWNETVPFALDEFGPSYEPPKPNDPANGTLDERRRGSFPIGLAVDALLPAQWGSSAGKTVRVAVIGQGDVFSGAALTPPKEQLLLQTTNWLLGREDLLPRAEAEWKYPRVAVKPGQDVMVLLAGLIGLPAAFVFLGVLVLLAQRVR